MSQPQVDEISIKVDYGASGEPKGFRYLDQEGCGHESENMDLLSSVLGLIRYHLDHLKKSHGISTKPMCGFKIHAEMGEKGCPLTCKLERHGADTKHQFEL